MRWRSNLPLLLSALPLFLLLVLPVAAVIGALPLERLREGLASPVAAAAFRVSLTATTCSLLLIVAGGTPLAYLLARRPFPGRRLVEALVDLPLAIPPAVLGVGLLLVFGRYRPIGAWLDRLFGLQIGFSLAAVVLAQAAVAAPLYVRTAQEAFAAVDPALTGVARTLGATAFHAFWRVTLPLAAPGLLTGAGLAWARALGEFGATILFAGNLRGRTQTLPLAVYATFESDFDAALAISALLALFGFAALLLWRGLGVRRAAGGPFGAAAQKERSG